jgi:hypothetical protein
MQPRVGRRSGDRRAPWGGFRRAYAPRLGLAEGRAERALRRPRSGVRSSRERRRSGGQPNIPRTRPRRSMTAGRPAREGSSATRVPIERAKNATGAPPVFRQSSGRARWRGRASVKRLVPVLIAGLVLYGVAPAVLEVLGAYRRLGDLDPAWWLAVLGASAAGTWCMFAQRRMALNGGAAARSAAADPRRARCRRSRAHRHAGVGRRPGSAGRTGHARLPACLILASVPDWPSRVDLTSPALRRGGPVTST